MSEEICEEVVEKFILNHLTQEKWDGLGDILKTRYINITRNYLTFPEAENFMPLPDFLRKPVQNGKRQAPKSVRKRKHEQARAPVAAPAEENGKLRQNPKRKAAEQKNYFEPEEPSDDRYVFCDNCGVEYLDFCSKCGMLKSLKNFPVPVGAEDRAKKTLPKGVLEIRPSQIHGLGVFALRQIEKGIQMGPYEGQITRVNTTNGYCWKLRDGRLIDAADETCSNWLRYVNCARHMEEQNIAAFQYKGNLYYRTCKEIQKGDELLVYYGESFAKDLGIDIKKYFQPKEGEVDEDVFNCQYCCIGLGSKDYRDTHQRHCKFRQKRVADSSENFVCQHCSCAFTSENFAKSHEKHCTRNPKRMVSGVKEKNFQCQLCSKKFTTKTHLNRHEVIHNKENLRMFKCEQCSFRTIHLRSLQAHSRMHDTISHLTCIICKKCFNQKVHLDSHILNNHKDNISLIKTITSKIHNCSHCTYKTVKKSHLRAHVSCNHNRKDAETFKCDKCHYYSLKKSNLRIHMLTHSTQNKPFKCTDCRKEFNQKVSLDFHIVGHHKQNPTLMKAVTHKIHNCDDCDYKTVYVHNLKRHIKSKHKNVTGYS